MDLYRNFNTLAAHEVENKDFRIRVRDLKSPVSIVAPHGGRIEPGTCLIAQKIAGTLYNYYCFEGLKDKRNKSLHITSHRFDEPRALDLITASDVVVTIHACKDRTNTVYIGGLYRDLALKIDKYLTKIKFHVAKQENYAGIHPDNICNKAKIKKGVQLEISRSIRDDPEKTEALSAAVQHCLNRFTSTLIRGV